MGWTAHLLRSAATDGRRGLGSDAVGADVQEVVPGKLVVLRGPVGLPEGQPWRNITSGDGRPVDRAFSPMYHVPGLRRLGVRAVVRLNAPEYDAAAFAREGLGFVDLTVADGACPSPEAAAKFLRIVDAVPGAVAVHSAASLGRAPTLTALYLIRRHDFTAREAVAWLRILRPGSVLASQLQYLVGREAVLRRDGPTWSGSATSLLSGMGGPGAASRPRRVSGQAAGGGDDVFEIIAKVVAEVDDRLGLAKGADLARPGLEGRGARMRRSESFVSDEAGATGSAAASRAAMRSRGSFFSRSCPTLGSLFDSDGDPGPSGRAGGGVGGESPDGTASPIRFCADLLPLPTS